MEKETQKKNTLEGTVVSNKMAKTIVVSVKRFVKHPKYGKYITSAKKYKAHYEGDTLGLGSKVLISPIKPISKDKHYVVSKVLVTETQEKMKFEE